jgi:hypothetical protein
VEASDELTSLAKTITRLTRARSSARLVLPTQAGSHQPVRVNANGVLSAFGETIDTAEPFDLSYVWAFGSKSARRHLDALVVSQSDSAVALSLNQRPGGSPAAGALPSATPEMPNVELSPNEILSPACLGALVGFLERAPGNAKKQRDSA